MAGPGGPREEPDVPVDVTSLGLSLSPSFLGSHDPQASPHHPSRPLPLTGLNPWWATAPTSCVQQCPGHSQGRQLTGICNPLHPRATGFSLGDTSAGLRPASPEHLSLEQAEAAWKPNLDGEPGAHRAAGSGHSAGPGHGSGGQVSMFARFKWGRSHRGEGPVGKDWHSDLLASGRAAERGGRPGPPWGSLGTLTLGVSQD